jgi:hypothetical protein
MRTQFHDRPMPPRIVHLLGGLRAVDDRENPVRIEAGHDQRFAQFSAPSYRNLYGDLMASGLQPIGAEFVNRQSLEGLAAPDWQCASPGQGFKLRIERDLWAGVRHAAINSGDLIARDLAERASTYLDLLPIRILQLSEAYNQTLRAFLADGGGDSIFFQNSFGRYIDAAIHGFVADAASLRDIIAEALWKLIVKEAVQVTTLATFLKKAKAHPHKLVQSVIAAGKEGGWLKNLSDLRNHITHVAPLGRSAEFHMCQPRKAKIGRAIEATVLHYPLLEGSGALRPEQAPVDFSDEATVKARLQEYKSYCDSSIDALDYAWRTLAQLVDLLAELRAGAGLRSETMTLTDEDLVGEVTIRS